MSFGPDDSGPSMGEYEYWYALCNNPHEDAIYESSAHHPLLDEESPPSSLNAPIGKWRVRGGALLEISKMSTEHLRNAIRFFTRAGRGDHAKIQELWEELARRFDK